MRGRVAGRRVSADNHEQRVRGKVSEKTERGLGIKLHWVTLPALALEARVALWSCQVIKLSP